jgi:hypothetical protein
VAGTSDPASLTCTDYSGANGSEQTSPGTTQISVTPSITAVQTTQNS